MLTCQVQLLALHHRAVCSAAAAAAARASTALCPPLPVLPLVACCPEGAAEQPSAFCITTASATCAAPFWFRIHAHSAVLPFFTVRRPAHGIPRRGRQECSNEWAPDGEAQAGRCVLVIHG